MSDSDAYTGNFHSDRDSHTRNSAEAVISLLFELIRPESVVDVGCGVGTWLATFTRMGCRDVLGIDGAYVQTELLQIPPERFRPHDLTMPISLERQFDLAMSLEVAEHLESQYAQQFVRSLTRLAPVLLFSAAIPFQGGVHHVNEQWPDYWHALFKAHGFVCIDALRERLWNRTDVLYWYRQNILLYVSEAALAERAALQRAYERQGGAPRALVHPDAYLLKCAPLSMRAAVSTMLRTAGKELRRALVPGSALKT